MTFCGSVRSPAVPGILLSVFLHCPGCFYIVGGVFTLSWAFYLSVGVFAIHCGVLLYCGRFHL